MHRIHKDSTRCSTVSTFECPTCSIYCKTGNELNDHMNEHHPQLSSLSLVSEASSSSWTQVTCAVCQNVFMNELDLENHIKDQHNKVDLDKSLSGFLRNTCTICRKEFKNEWDLKHHTLRVHEYGETCLIYPCEECGFIGDDVTSLDSHVKDHHSEQQNSKDDEELLAEDSDEDTFTTLSEISVQKRIKQNLANINFDEDSDDDNEYSPTIEEEEEFEALNIATKQQRKRKNETDLPQPKKKTKPLPKADTSLSCELCQITYSRKDNLKRHVLKKH